jgi:hypothetical protein
MQPYRLEHWSLLRRFSRSKGGVREYLTGEVYDDPSYPEGTRIVTSAVVSRDGREVVTSSGAHYLLEGESERRDVPESANDLTQGIGQGPRGTGIPC